MSVQPASGLLGVSERHGAPRDRAAPAMNSGTPEASEHMTLGRWRLRDRKRGLELHVCVNWPVSDGPFAVVIFSHGAWGSKDGYLALT